MRTIPKQLGPPYNYGYLDQHVEHTISEMRKCKTAGDIGSAAVNAYTLMNYQSSFPIFRIPALDEAYAIFQDLMKQWRSKGYSRFVNLNYWIAVHDALFGKRIAKKFGVTDISKNQATIEQRV